MVTHSDEKQGVMNSVSADRTKSFNLKTRCGFIRYWAAAPDAPLIIFFHGLESHSSWFADLALALQARGFASLAWDRPGFGQSAREFPGHLESSAELRAQFENFLEVLNELQLLARKTHLCGLSWGGLAALYLLKADEKLACDRFLSLTLLVPGLFSRVPFSLKIRAKIAAWALLPPCTENIKKRKKEALTQLIKLPLEPAMFSSQPEKQHFIKQDPHRTTAVTRAFCFTTWRMMQEVRRMQSVPVKTLTLLSATDEITNPQKTKRLMQKIGSDVVTIPETKHSLVLEAPDEVALLMVGHLRAAEQDCP
jgi:alpha-beta hydrolase superfamily lysophospholipase